MTNISFTSGELMDIVDVLEIKENQHYIAGDHHLAAYYMNLGNQFNRIIDRLKELPGEKRVAHFVVDYDKGVSYPEIK